MSCRGGHRKGWGGRREEKLSTIAKSMINWEAHQEGGLVHVVHQKICRVETRVFAVVGPEFARPGLAQFNRRVTTIYHFAVYKSVVVVASGVYKGP